MWLMGCAWRRAEAGPPPQKPPPPPARDQPPLFPPAFASSRRSLISMPLLAALHMSYTVSAATAAAVSASISTPVGPVQRASAHTPTLWLPGSSRSCAARARACVGERGVFWMVKGVG